MQTLSHLVCETEPTVLSIHRRTMAFFCGGIMPKIKHECKICSKIFYAYKSSNRKFCSIKCVGINNSLIKTGFNKGMIPWNKGKKFLRFCGNNHPNWKGGRYQDAKGYIVIRIDGKRMFEHRFIMEKELKRNLFPEEIVHHLNEIKNDNRIENLIVVSVRDHFRLYHSKK